MTAAATQVVLPPKRLPGRLDAAARRLEIRTAGPMLSLVLLGLLVVAPVMVMLLASVRPAATLPLASRGWTLANFADVFGDPSLPRVLFTTLVFAVGSLGLALPVALGLAILSERTDIPARNWLYTAMFVPMTIPSFATALGWVLLLGPTAGTLNVWLRVLLGSSQREGPLNILSLPGMIVIQALASVPTLWLFLISVLRHMDVDLEEAAAVAGANRWRSFTFVTLPLVLPAMLGLVALGLLVSIESLEVPLALGRSTGIDVLATRVYDLLITRASQINYGPPAVLGVLGLVLGIVAIRGYFKLVGRGNAYAVVTGKGFRPRLIALGWWRVPALAVFAAFLLVDVAIPAAVLITTSIQRFYQPLVPGVEIVWTTRNFESLLDFRFFGQYFLNTVIVAVAAASATMVLVSFFSWQTVRFPSGLTRAVQVLAFMPLAIPAVISGLAFFLLFIGTSLYGTLALLVIAFTSRYLAFGTRLMHSAQLQIHRELEEAALVGGVGRLTTFVYVNLRLLLPAFVNGWLWVLTHAARDFTTPLMVASAGSLLVGNVIFDAYQRGSFPASAAMMVVLMAFNVSVVLAGRKWIVRAIG